MKTNLIVIALLTINIAAIAQDRKGSFEFTGGYGYNFATIGGQTLPHSPEILFKNLPEGVIEGNVTTKNNNLLNGSLWSVDLGYYITPKTAIVIGYATPSTNTVINKIDDSTTTSYRTRGQYFSIGLKHNYLNKNKVTAFVGAGVNVGFFKHRGWAYTLKEDSIEYNQFQSPNNVDLPGHNLGNYTYQGGVYLGFNLYTGVEYQLSKRFSVYADIYSATFWGKPREFDYRSVYFSGINSNTPGISDNLKRPSINMNFISARAGLRVHFYKKG